MNSKTIFASVLSGLLLISVLPTVADAATILVKCEKRSGRSKVSVDGNNLRRGLYKCQAISGANKATTRQKGTIGDELECDFDSNRNDILAGATPISSSFIQNNRVTGKIFRKNSQGKFVQYLVATATCRNR